MTALANVAGVMAVGVAPLAPPVPPPLPPPPPLVLKRKKGLPELPVEPGRGPIAVDPEGPGAPRAEQSIHGTVDEVIVTLPCDLRTTTVPLALGLENASLAVLVMEIDV